MTTTMTDHPIAVGGGTMRGVKLTVTTVGFDGRGKKVTPVSSDGAQIRKLEIKFGDAAWPDEDTGVTMHLVPTSDITPENIVYKFVYDGSAIATETGYFTVPDSGPASIRDHLTQEPGEVEPSWASSFTERLDGAEDDIDDLTATAVALDGRADALEATYTVSRSANFTVNQGSANNALLGSELVATSDGRFTPLGSTVDATIEVVGVSDGIAHIGGWLYYSQTVAHPIRDGSLTTLPGVTKVALDVMRTVAGFTAQRHIIGLTPGVPVNYEVVVGVLGYYHYTASGVAIPTGLAGNSDGTYLYTADGGGTLAQWRTPRTFEQALLSNPDEKTGETTCGTLPWSVAVNADGSKAAVGNRTSNSVTVVDTATMTPSLTISSAVPAGSLSSVAYGPTGSLYVQGAATGGTANQLVKYDAAGAQVWSTNVANGFDASRIAVSPDGTKIAVPGLTSSALRVVTDAGASATVGSAVALGGNCGSCAWMPTGPGANRDVWCAVQTVKAARRVNTTTGAITATSDVCSTNASDLTTLCIDPLGGSAFVVAATGTIGLTAIIVDETRPAMVGVKWEQNAIPGAYPVTDTHGTIFYVRSSDNAIVTFDGATFTVLPSDGVFLGRASITVKGAQ